MEKEAMGLRIPCFREFSEDIEYIKSIFENGSIEKFCEYCGNIAEKVLERIHDHIVRYTSEYRIKDVKKIGDEVTIEVSASNVSPDKLSFTCEIKKNPNSESDFLFFYF